MTVWVYSLPMPMFIAGILWVGAGILGLFAPSNVGDIAHLSGIAIGFIFGLLWRQKLAEPKNDKIVLDERHIREWEERHL